MFTWWFAIQTCDIFSIFVGPIRQTDSEGDATERLLADGNGSLGKHSPTLAGCDFLILEFYLRCRCEALGCLILILLALNTLSVNSSTSGIFL